MAFYSVYAHVHDMITIIVQASSPDRALGCARERLCVDRLPSAFATVSQPHELTADDLDCGRRFDDSTHTKISDMAQGRTLTADELQYCRGRGYDRGYDIDAFDGIQWSHIVDDSVALCRTTALWGFGGGFHATESLSCPFCLRILHEEMRYPYLNLMIERRRTGQRKVAEVVMEADRVIVLKVNGIVVRTGRLTERSANYNETADCGQRDDYDDFTKLALEINTAEGPLHVAPLSRAYVGYSNSSSDTRRAGYIQKQLILDDDNDANVPQLSEERRAKLQGEAEILRAEMTLDEKVEVDRYLERP